MLKDLCFEIIQTCPNICKFCSSRSSMQEKTMIEYEQYAKTIEYFMRNGGIEELSISGGEPFLHPRLFDMVKLSKAYNIKTVIFSSGIKLLEPFSEEEISKIKSECQHLLEEIEENEPWNDRVKENIIRRYQQILNAKFTSISDNDFKILKEMGLDKIVFDWQSADEIIDKDLMGRRCSYTLMMQSIIRAKKIGLNVDIHFIPLKPNYKQLPDILRCLEIAGVKNISILNFVPQGRGLENKEELMLNADELKEFFNILKEAQAHFNGTIRIGIPLNEKLSHMCTAGTEKLDIKYDGTILPCPAFKELSIETMQKYGIRLHNIYKDLEKVNVCGGKRSEPLCKKVYEFYSDTIE